MITAERFGRATGDSLCEQFAGEVMGGYRGRARAPEACGRGVANFVLSS